MPANSVEPSNIQCPYCGETIEILIDCSVEKQTYIEDCQVCCRPIDVDVVIDETGMPIIEVSREDDI